MTEQDTQNSQEQLLLEIKYQLEDQKENEVRRTVTEIIEQILNAVIFLYLALKSIDLGLTTRETDLVITEIMKTSFALLAIKYAVISLMKGYTFFQLTDEKHIEE